MASRQQKFAVGKHGSQNALNLDLLKVTNPYHLNDLEGKIW